MQLYLHWWLNSGIQSEIDYYYSLLKQIIQEQSAQQVLHLPFARTGIYTKNRESTQPLCMKPFIESLGIEYLDAKYIESYEKAKHPMILMTGGNDTENLYNQIIHYDSLHKLVINASCIFADSAGPMICWNKWFDRNNHQIIMKGLWIMDCIVIPHSAQFSDQEAKEIMHTADTSHCFMIEENTVVKIDTNYQSDYKVFWKWNVKLLTS